MVTPHGSHLNDVLLAIESGKPVPTSTLSASFSGQCGDPIGPASWKSPLPRFDASVLASRPCRTRLIPRFALSWSWMKFAVALPKSEVWS